MDQLDKYIESIVSQKISEPENLDQIIMDAISSAKCKKKMKENKIKKIILTSLIAVFGLSGVGIAGYITYEKIWKDPEKYTYEEIQESLADANNVEMANLLITEEQAKQNASQILSNLGYGNEEIKSIELQKDINRNNEPFYIIKTGDKENENMVITLDANDGDFMSFTNNSFQNININETLIDNETAKKYSEEIVKNIGVTEKEYQYKNCNQQQIVFNNGIKNVWVAEYNKIYDGICNLYEMLKTNFVINDNNLEISSIIETSDGVYDNNPEVITEEQAKEIAVNKEKEFTDKEIESVEAEKGIRKMNEYIYNLENGYSYDNNVVQNKQNQIFENKNARKTWLIKVMHKNLNENIDSLDTNERLEIANKIYYIDATTGEILGGEELIEGGS